ncbi:hypothetical protein GWK47_004213 [Chionoecetes opilio]|uniref:Transmembrane protein n=1 Tax=Chionoecetes opilio TaxID=41210 RepID=A0A8J4YEX4_CHIOP|nr:hypothetical protein GWK47_004213 [Chionoecetes opilio]
MRYKGLFSPQAAPTTRAYCLLLSFLIGTLMLTAGSVFYHVILSRPMSGSHPMHTPPLALALTLILCGVVTLLSCFLVAWKYGFDDGDDAVEDDLYILAVEDVLAQRHAARARAADFSSAAPPSV